MVDPNIWGPCGWKFLSYIAINYPEYPTDDEKMKYKQFILTLQHVLPCKICSKNMTEYIAKNLSVLESKLSSKENLFSFFVDLHNDINTKNGKKQFTYLEAKNALLDMQTEESTKIIESAYKFDSSKLFITTVCVFILNFIR